MLVVIRLTYTYNLSATNFFGCEGVDTIEVTVEVIDNINKENENSLVNIYPNPASNIVTINAPLNTSISIIDIYGRLITIWENNTSSKVLDVSEYSSGLYFIKVSEKDNTETLKLIVE